MVKRYVQFKAAISSIYKSIQKIERQEMERFGLKGPHVQCLVAISRHSEGIVAARLCEICDRDKASISRSLSELEAKGLVLRESGYRGNLSLTEEGRAVTEQILHTATQAVETASLNFDEETRALFHRSLEHIAANLQAISEEGVSHHES